MNKRQEQKQKTRQQIRLAAKQLFIAQGYEASTSRQIAQEAGVALGTIFVHFSDKSAILADILYEDIEDVLQQAFANLPATETLSNKLLYLATELYTYYLRHPDLSRVLVQKGLFNKEDAAFSEQVKVFIKAVASLFKQAQARAEMAETKDAEALAELFMAAYLFVLLALLRSDFSGLDEARDKLELLIRTLLG